MKIAIVYIYPLDGQGPWEEKADRFVHTYLQHPPGLHHETLVVCNGGSLSIETELRFCRFPELQLIHHDGRGKDIGGYLKAAASTDADLMIFFGAHTYFRGPEWMLPVLRSWLTKGDTLYGATGHPGEYHVRPHIRTTGFWMNPKHMASYCPTMIENDRRYEFEHGESCLTRWFQNRGKLPWVVSWTAEHRLQDCLGIPNGYRNGNGSNVVFGDNHTG